MLSREEAEKILFQLTETVALRRHARSVELVMRHLARILDQDEDLFGITGLLHDADYEKFPDEHPMVIVQKLRTRGELEIAHAIAGHYTKWGISRDSMLDKSIVAADELTGFTYAAALIRPTKIEGMTASSVLKKLKTKGFAASVDRDEVYKGAELLDWPLEKLIEVIIEVLSKHRKELDLEQ